jgi:5,10-methylenetetrahydrofolate reductase
MGFDRLLAGGIGGKPLVCLEVNPPRGVDPKPVFERLEGKLAGIDFLNVTDSALARMKSSPLPFAALVKERLGIEPLVNVSCRDRNLIALQADLLAGWMGGVRSIVALTGDAVTVGDSPDRKGVFEVNSIGLLNTIKTLNSGVDLAGNKLSGAPSFISGVVTNPNAKNVAAEVRRLTKKREAGAVYALSQPVFDAGSAISFLTEAKAAGVGILLGLMPFRTLEGAKALSEIPGIRMPQTVLDEVAALQPSAIADYSIRLCESLAAQTRELTVGVHVIGGAAAKLGLELAQTLGAKSSFGSPL